MIHTKIVKVDSLNPQEQYLKEAAQIIRTGGLVIIPTETVYGIAANCSNTRAIERLYKVKGRPKAKPFSLHIEDKDKVEQYAHDISTAAYKLMDAFWPGALTLVFHSTGDFTIGIRMPDNEIALKVIGLSGVPVVCPSANLSGNPAPKTFNEAIKDLSGLVDYAIDSGETMLQVESSVVDATVNPPKMLREGAIKQDEIMAIAGKKTVLFICTGNSCRSVMAKGLLEKRLREKGRKDVEVLSAGIMAGGLLASADTQMLLAREGIDVSRHRSQRATPMMVKKSDLILVMETLHEQKITELVPQAKKRVFLLKEFAKIDGNHLDIDDPISSSAEYYEKIFNVIKEAVDKIVEII